MAETIEFKVKGSKVTIDAIGFSGPACEAATLEAERALGTVIERNKKTDYWRPTTTKTEQKAGR